MLRVVLLLICFTTAVHAEPSLEKLIAEMGSKNVRTRDFAYYELRRRKDVGVIPLLLAAAPNYEFRAQLHSVTLIGELPASKSLPALRTLSTAKSPYLRITAAAQLHKLGQKGVVPVMIAALREQGLTENELGYMLVRVKGIRDPGLGVALRALLRDDRKPSNVYWILMSGSVIGYQRGNGDAAKALVARSSSAGIRAVAAACLVAKRASEYESILADIMRTNRLDAGTFDRVRSFLDVGKRYPDAVLDAIADWAPEEPNAWLVVALIRFTAESGRSKNTDWIQGMVAHTDGRVVSAAVEALTALGVPLKAELLEKLLQSKDDGAALAAAQNLRRRDDLSGLRRAIAIVGSKSAQRSRAIEVIGEFRSAEAIEPLLACMSDAKPAIRDAALRALHKTLTGLFPYRRFDHRLGLPPEGAPATSREAAIAKLRAWWDSHKGDGW